MGGVPAAFGAVLALWLSGCAMPDGEPEAIEPAEVADVVPPVEPAPAIDAAPEPSPEPEPPPLEPVAVTLSCGGAPAQGGVLLCRSAPGARLTLDGKAVAQADADGLAVIGLARTQKSPAKVALVAGAAHGETQPQPLSIDIAKRTDILSRFEMECDKIQAQTPAQKRHAEVSWVKKDNALKTFSAPLASYGLIKPAEGPYSSPFGATRTYQPKTPDCEGSTSVHNGQDIAIPTGTPILAPMAGTVLLADPDLYYEGGAVFLDLGHGLVSVTMHMSRIDVANGDVVAQGETLGLSGATGRVTGPHLHWAIKYRNVNDTDRGSDIWLDPVLLMQAGAAAN